jgi:NitT/TauT family transport system permease protein
MAETVPELEAGSAQPGATPAMGMGSAQPGATSAEKRAGPAAVWETASRLILPAAVVGVFLAIWQWVPLALNIPTYELPNLGATVQGLRDDWPSIGNALLVTVQDALTGFILGNALAILGATVFSYSKSMERAFYPLAILVQTIPIIVFVPLFTIVLNQNQVPAFINSNAQGIAVVAVTILISFFPTLVNMNVGFKTIDPRIHELMRLLNASRTQIFLKLRFPSAIPFLFSSLKITSTLAFVGAVVGEWMANSGINPVGQTLDNAGVHQLFGFPTNPFQATGVGGQLNIFFFRLDKPGLFASVLAISILSMCFFGLMVLLERLVVPWRHSE